MVVMILSSLTVWNAAGIYKDLTALLLLYSFKEFKVVVPVIVKNDKVIVLCKLGINAFCVTDSLAG